MSYSNLIRDHIHRPTEDVAYPAALDSILSRTMAEEALGEISSWPGYAPTPLLELKPLANALDLGSILYKDEGHRLGLGSFKALGGAYAVMCFAAARLEEMTGTRPSLSDIRKGAYAEALRSVTVATATDGNHGRSVAWGAQMAGCQCKIFIHAEVSAGRKAAMEAFGAEVIRIDGDYDASVHRCAEEAAAHGWQIISDTSYEGYMDIPRTVMAGYSVLASEAIAQADAPPTHIFVQAGVGGVAAAVLARFWQEYGANHPHVIVVEPDRAACVFESARQGRAMTVPISEETIMAGLSCGEVSLLAWEILSRGAADFVTIGEEGVGPAMRLLASGRASDAPITAGESAVPGLIALVGAAARQDLRQILRLGPDSRILVIGCEGATDPEIYHRIVDAPGADDASLMPDL